jgi:transcriptional repressor NrdR
MQCPYCQSNDSRVIDTSHDSRGGIRRRRECQTCQRRFTTYERAIQATPMLVKQDGTREAFDREKLISGIRISCAKRPVAAADIERLVGEIEAALQAMGQAEVSSRRLHSLRDCLSWPGRPAGHSQRNRRPPRRLRGPVKARGWAGRTRPQEGVSHEGIVNERPVLVRQGS